MGSNTLLFFILDLIINCIISLMISFIIFNCVPVKMHLNLGVIVRQNAFYSIVK